MLQISAYAHIKNHQVSVNGTIVFKTNTKQSFTEFLSEAYKSLNISYPKFHKTDLQCKLGLLCTEFALQNTSFLSQHSLDKIAIVLSNNASSIETDRNYQASINDSENYFPSPAVFVYTLPNIVIGELAIKHKLTGENAFFVTEKFDTNLLANYSTALLNETTNAVINGWINVDNNDYEAFIFLAEKQTDTNKSSIFKLLNELTITTLYNQTQWTL